MSETDIDKELELINDIIHMAIFHGGDGGGAYFSDAESLNESIQEWLVFRELDKEYTTTYELKKDKYYIAVVKK